MLVGFPITGKPMIRRDEVYLPERIGHDGLRRILTDLGDYPGAVGGILQAIDRRMQIEHAGFNKDRPHFGAFAEDVDSRGNIGLRIRTNRPMWRVHLESIFRLQRKEIGTAVRGMEPRAAFFIQRPQRSWLSLAFGFVQACHALT